MLFVVLFCFIVSVESIITSYDDKDDVYFLQFLLINSNGDRCYNQYNNTEKINCNNTFVSSIEAWELGKIAISDSGIISLVDYQLNNHLNNVITIDLINLYNAAANESYDTLQIHLSDSDLFVVSLGYIDNQTYVITIGNDNNFYVSMFMDTTILTRQQLPYEGNIIEHSLVYNPLFQEIVFIGYTEEDSEITYQIVIFNIEFTNMSLIDVPKHFIPIDTALYKPSKTKVDLSFDENSFIVLVLNINTHIFELHTIDFIKTPHIISEDDSVFISSISSSMSIISLSTNGSTTPTIITTFIPEVDNNLLDENSSMYVIDTWYYQAKIDKFTTQIISGSNIIEIFEDLEVILDVLSVGEFMFKGGSNTSISGILTIDITSLSGDIYDLDGYELSLFEFEPVGSWYGIKIQGEPTDECVDLSVSYTATSVYFNVVNRCPSFGRIIIISFGVLEITFLLL